MKNRSRLIRKITNLLGITFITLGMIPVPVLSQIGSVYAQVEDGAAAIDLPAFVSYAELLGSTSVKVDAVVEAIVGLPEISGVHGDWISLAILDPVLADDGDDVVPTEEPAAEEPPAEEPPAEEPVAEEPAVEEPPAEEEPMCEGEECAPEAEELPAEEEPVCEGEACAPEAEELPVEEPVCEGECAPEEGEEPAEETPEAEVVAEIVVAAAENDLVLADASGEPLEMAKQETFEILAVADPYFYVGATKYCYVHTLETCSCDHCDYSDTPIQNAIDDAESLSIEDNTIYILPGVYTEEVYIDYGNLTLLGEPGVVLRAPIGLTDDPGDVTNLIHIFGAEGVTILGLELDGSNLYTNREIVGIFIEDSHKVDIIQNIIHDTAIAIKVKDSGVIVPGQNDNQTVDKSIRILNNTIMNNEKGVLVEGTSTVFANFNFLMNWDKNFIDIGDENTIDAGNNVWAYRDSNGDILYCEYNDDWSTFATCAKIEGLEYEEVFGVPTTERGGNCRYHQEDHNQKIETTDATNNGPITFYAPPGMIILHVGVKAGSAISGDGCSYMVAPQGGGTVTFNECYVAVWSSDLTAVTITRIGTGTCKEISNVVVYPVPFYDTPSPYCGDGHLDPDEDCDDGNRRDGDGCSANCTFESTDPTCGDGEVNQAWEKCDGDDVPEGFTCRSDCHYCGDGTVESGDPGYEACDPGINDNCSSECEWEDVPRCGDGEVNQAWEKCDGDDVPEGYTCRADCHYCGDGTVETPPEACDPGVDDHCSDTCEIEEWCGDEELNVSGETCDPPGETMSNGNVCRDTCTYCGDGKVNGGEACDDGNKNNLDGCRNNCTLPTTTTITVFTPLPLFIIPVTGQFPLITAGIGHTCALTAKEGLECWGLNESGQVGDRTFDDTLVPVDVVDIDPTTVIGLVSGIHHTCVLTSANEVFCWGLNSSGQLGDGTTENSNVPLYVDGLEGTIIAISAGAEFTCALNSDKDVFCWGNNSSGQLNDGTEDHSSVPVKTTTVSSDTVLISGGSVELQGITSDGAVQLWNSQPIIPVTGYPEEDNSFVSADRFTEGGCSMTNTGDVNCWGGITNAQVKGAVVSDMLSSGKGHACTMKTEGLVCWGSNSNGQLGDDSTDDSDEEVLVVELEQGVIALAAGMKHTCVIYTDEDIACWGLNDYGQLGNDTIDDSMVPETTK